MILQTRDTAEYDQSAETQVEGEVREFASRDVEGVTGRCYEDCAEAKPGDECGTRTGGVARNALDPSNAERLWQISTELTQYRH